MSNKSIKQRIEASIQEFKADKISIKDLKESIELNGNALEMMPYPMIKELDEIEYKLTVSQFADEEDCYSNIEEILEFIAAWLEKVPVENAE
jgi:hypothetical protein